MSGFGLSEWLRAAYGAAKLSLAHARRRCGRRFINLAQAATVRLLMERLRLGVDECRSLLRARPDLRRAVRFLHVPSRGGSGTRCPAARLRTPGTARVWRGDRSRIYEQAVVKSRWRGRRKRVRDCGGPSIYPASPVTFVVGVPLNEFGAAGIDLLQAGARCNAGHALGYVTASGAPQRPGRAREGISACITCPFRRFRGGRFTAPAWEGDGSWSGTSDGSHAPHARQVVHCNGHCRRPC